MIVLCRCMYAGMYSSMQCFLNAMLPRLYPWDSNFDKEKANGCHSRMELCKAASNGLVNLTDFWK